ncbi:MAG: hypothetical protein ACYC35_26415 [Pirellulales bacterium]
MQMVIRPDGEIRAVYDELIDLAALGQVTIRRGSHVEPDPRGRWFADLAPAAGPRLGPFLCRSQALEAEGQWLESNWL